MCAALLFVRAKGEPHDNGYAHPLDGVIAIVDVNKLQGFLFFFLKKKKINYNSTPVGKEFCFHRETRRQVVRKVTGKQ